MKFKKQVIEKISKNGIGVFGDLMGDSFKFSIVTAIYNSEKYLEETIRSVINQDIGFEENIQLILVDDGSTDNSKDIAIRFQKQYPKNIVVLSKENGGPASARNLGLDHVAGKYVNFLDSDDKLSSNSLKSVYQFFSRHDEIDLVSIPMIFFDRREGDHYLNYKFESNKVVDLEKEIDYPQLSGASTFTRAEAIKGHKFNENLINGEDIVFVNEILLKKLKYGLVSDAVYYVRKRGDLSSIIDNRFTSKRAFTEKMRLCYKHLIDYCEEKLGHVPDFIKYLIILDLKGIVTSKEFDGIFDDEDELQEFWEVFYYILSHVDIEIISNHRNLHPQVKYFLIFLKQNDFHIVARPQKNKVFLKSKDYIINKLHNRKIILDVIELKNGFLNISGAYTSNCYNEHISIELIKEDASGKKVVFKPSYVDYWDRQTDRYLSIDWKFRDSFDFKVPIDDNQISKIRFKVIYDEGDSHVEMAGKIQFGRYADLSQFSTYSIKDSNIVFVDGNDLIIDSYSYSKLFKLTLKDIKNILASHEEKSFKAILFRLFYLFAYSFMKNKRIWLFEDRLTSADDNAEHLFEYALGMDDGIEKYFVIKEDCPDYNRLKELSKNILGFSSLKHKILYLFAEKIISSRIDHSTLNPFYRDNLILYNGLFTIQRCFLQNGVIDDDLSYWIKKHETNLHLFLTSSELEHESLLENKYNYDGDVVQILGMPRYDNLKYESSKKQVLFMPTLRKDIQSSELFEGSSNYLKINSLINNERFLGYLKDNDYTLVFRPPVEILEPMDLFDIPDDVILADEESCQKLINESSLFITNFSTAAFDFAYVKKPIIYYQEKKDDHNSDGSFDYEKMGFGDVIESEDDLVNRIIEYIDNGCEMEEEYRQRVNRFYKYDDRNNCQRVYDWLSDNPIEVYRESKSNKFKFSIVMAVYNVDMYIGESIDSIINQTLDFEENVQIIIVDDGSSDNSLDVALDYQKRYPDNILVFSKENEGPASARNLGLTYATGDYVNFLDPDDLLSKDTLEEVLNFFDNSTEDIPFVAIPMVYFEGMKGDHVLNYKFDGHDRVVDVLQNPEFIQLSSSSAFFKNEIVTKYRFHEKSVRSEDAFVINKILIENPKYGLLNKPTYHYRKRYSFSSLTNIASTKKEFFTDFLKDYCLELIEYSLKYYDKVPKFIQYLLVYDIRLILVVPEISKVLNKEELDEFWEYFDEIMTHIDEDVIENHLDLNKEYKGLFIYLKNKDFHIVARPKKNKLFLKSNDYVINRVHNHIMRIDFVNFEKNYLYVSGSFASNCKSDVLTIQAVKKTSDGEETYNCLNTEYPTTYRHNHRCADIDWKFYYGFDGKIPVSNDEQSKITLRIKYEENGEKVYLYPNVDFRSHSHLSDMSSHFVKDSKIILNIGNDIHIKNYSFTGLSKLELGSIRKLFASGISNKFHHLFIRLCYLLLFNSMKNKRIWLFMDKQDCAGDNGEYLFDYSTKQDDGIKKYFVIDKSSRDYKRMQKSKGNILSYGSLKHKILFAFSEKVISSQVEDSELNPFYDDIESYTGLSLAQKCFLKQGVIKEDLSDWLAKFKSNLHLFLTSSKLERSSVIDGHYNYDEDVVQLLGMPRYDKLDKKDNKKQIIFMPAWRSVIANKDMFLASDFYKRLNAFLTNETIVGIAEKNGYKLIFRPPYAMEEYVVLLDIDDRIEVNTDESYFELFNESAILITDFSSVAFDFAYLKKPVIYFQQETEYPFENGYFDYDTMGFGNVITSDKELVDEISRCLENDCQMEEDFQKRVDEFFEFHDKDNSKRVYDWLFRN